ncbi:peptide/nickel transport system ATP-binding protein [Micromonospora sp. Llam0]|uniref:ABC transporter ATP-binding protein n=1 Tax=Micromonospora sp. Llam0 TaxID=2485143 RepID=UPI000FC26B41|nr:ABC transporter ATP-binding protein [Micromonospora sp. Llam0]ROO51395.1 peptide/nickel transport system ATP-binding protein [Micromonospora sp. Llam0]
MTDEMPAGTDDHVLDVRGLTVTVDAREPYDIVREVDFGLRAGGVLGLVGESGSGKTTLALSLLGFARDNLTLSGSVKVAGVEMVTATESARRSARGRVISYVPQDPMSALNPALRIGTQLAETMGESRWLRRAADWDRIRHLLERVKLPATKEFLRRFPHQLSGGQLQRVTIAMAMLNRPKAIVFDEPTTGLDVTTQAAVLDTIRDVIAEEGVAAVYVTHDLTVVGTIATRIAVMYSGLVVEDGPADEMLTASAHPYARRLILATPTVDQRRKLVGIAGTPLNPKERGTGCPFAARCDLVVDECLVATPEPVAVGLRHTSRCRRTDVVLAASYARPEDTGPQWTPPEHREPGLLFVRNVDISYGRRYDENRVLFGVDLTVREGECVALVGESGSGKTTLARAVSGLHKEAVDGRLHYDGQRMPWPSGSRTKVARREIQYIFQNPYGSLNPRHTIGRIITRPLETFGIVKGAARQREEVRRLLAQVSLPADYETRYPAQLSGGERQRVAIARALAARPRVLICDEITSALDVSIQASVLELLVKLRVEENLSLLFITHHIGVVRAIADSVVVLQNGVVVEAGSADQVLESPQHPYTEMLLRDTLVMPEAGSVDADGSGADSLNAGGTPAARG